MTITRVGLIKTKGSSSSVSTISTNSFTSEANVDLMVMVIGTGDTSAGGPGNPNAVSWNGSEAFTQIRQRANSDVRAEIWGLANPTQSVNAVATATLASLSGAMSICLQQYSLAALTATATTTDANNAAVVSNAVTSVSGDMVLDCIAVDNNKNPTHAAGQSLLANRIQGKGNNTIKMSSSEKLATSASTTMGWTIAGGGEEYAHVIVSINEIANALGVTLPLLGAGQ